MPFLYLIAIAWIYVVLLMSLSESSFVAGILTFIGYCVIPMSLVLYILTSSARKKMQRTKDALKKASEEEITPSK